MTVADPTTSFTAFRYYFQSYKLLLGTFLFFNEDKRINDNITGILSWLFLLHIFLKSLPVDYVYSKNVIATYKDRFIRLGMIGLKSSVRSLIQP